MFQQKYLGSEANALIAKLSAADAAKQAFHNR
jgi:hypothetical protein